MRIFCLCGSEMIYFGEGIPYNGTSGKLVCCDTDCTFDTKIQVTE